MVCLLNGVLKEMLFSPTLNSVVPKTFNAARYHSLAVCQNNLPETLDISASTDSGIIMGVRHRNSPIEGIQFHPESIATEYGHKILENFLSL